MGQSDKEYEKALLAWVKQQGVGVNIDADYSKGFSGTKMDTILEKGFADLMRGVDAHDAKTPFPRQPCTCTMADGGDHGADCKGKWLRTLNSQGTCYLYVHTITHEIRGSKPDNYISNEEMDAERKKKIEAALGGRWHAFPSCHLEEWREAVGRIVASEGKTPLLIVDEPHTYTALIARLTAPDKKEGELVNTRPFVLPVARTGVKFEDAFASMTKAITAGLRGGRPVVLDLEDASPHWLDKLCNVPKYRAKFPENIFNPRSQAWQREYGATAAPGFALVLITTLSPKDYEAELSPKLPWGHVKALRVSSHIPARYAYLADLTRVLEEASSASQARVPLLLDTTPEHCVDTFLAYQRTQQVDVPQLLSSARTPEEMREVLRSKLVACMRVGDTLLLRLKDSCPDFLTTYCSDDSFPLAAFSAGVVQGEEWRERLFKPEEREHGVTVCRDGFRLALTSWRPPATFAGDLGGGLPLHKLAVYAIEGEEEQ